ncbi:hypothetical protein [Fimbriimonas ginsengisoli]|uniref:Uncharacterized protein n=1 Tax=Fimbriimonas ginsengisoli Gsoil 348 TaxID=661478 RepID=A0A068NRJ8_FIMGI|nr:hypothetical protein [Fimbriimonas ginsengisoli]AIE84234.1 hypothetical protein OP10G_0866 [Fimbriimonas ginsengisoli Gsoil 348]
MEFGNDPAKWLVIALVAVVHLAVWAGYRFGGPFRWKGLAVALIPVLFCGPIPMFGQDLRQFWVLLTVPLLAGAYLALRLRSNGASFAAVACSMLVGGGLVGLASNCGAGATYMVGPIEWASNGQSATPSQILDDLAYRSERHGIGALKPRIQKAGYIDQWILPNNVRAPEGTVSFFYPVREWHSSITGLWTRRLRTFRIWTPAGPIERAIANARLVESTPGFPPASPSDPAPGLTRPQFETEFPQLAEAKISLLSND